MRHSSRVHKHNFLLHKKVIHPDCKIRKLLYYVKKEEVDDDDDDDGDGENNNNDEKSHPFGHLCFLCLLNAFFDFSSLPLINFVLSDESVVFRVRYFSILE